MAAFKIEMIQSLGWSHSGEETARGEGFVELTDEEVKVLVDLIREKGTADVNALELEEHHPALYEKLDKAYHDVAYKAEELYWLLDDFKNGYYDFDRDALIAYCEKECGYEFVPKLRVIQDYPNLDPEFIAVYLDMCKNNMDMKRIDFDEWLPPYLLTLPLDDAIAFIYKYMNPTMEMDDEVYYEVNIPQSIIDMASSERASPS